MPDTNDPSLKSLIQTFTRCNTEAVHNIIKKWAPEYINCTSFTLTLKPKLYTYQTITQYEMTHNELINIINQVHDYVYCTEITKTGNIHYHFVVKTNDKLRLVNLVNKIRKNRLFGFYKAIPINSIDHLHKAIMYLVKDVYETMQILWTNNYKPEVFDFKI